MIELEKLRGRDHRTLLLYVEDRCVNNRGVLDLLNLRVNEKRYPLLKIDDGHGFEPWDGSNGTRLNSGETLPDHDDIDCLDELADLGLVEIMSLVNGLVSMTEKGHEVAAELRARRAERGSVRITASFPCPVCGKEQEMEMTNESVGRIIPCKCEEDERGTSEKDSMLVEAESGLYKDTKTIFERIKDYLRRK